MKLGELYLLEISQELLQDTSINIVELCKND